MPPLTPMEMLSLFLPADMLDYFDLVNHVSQETCFILFLEEKPSIPQEYSHLHLHSKGFFPDFLFAVKLYSRDWNCESVLDTIFSSGNSPIPSSMA